jgi:nucleotidyltransferase substrate binding protein (TIGR01987 family)
MEKIALKQQQLLAALERLGQAVEYCEKVKKNELTMPALAQDELYRVVRDSLMQRFEFCADQFWKYLKLYLETQLSQPIDLNAPRPVIRTACKAKMISEEDAQLFLEMLDDRNMTSHIYREEIADIISTNTKHYHQAMLCTAQKLAPHAM